MPRRRMQVWAEIKWAIAVHLLIWIGKLTEREASREMLTCYADLAANFKNDPSFDTVPMRARS